MNISIQGAKESHWIPISGVVVLLLKNPDDIWVARYMGCYAAFDAKGEIFESDTDYHEQGLMTRAYQLFMERRNATS